MMRKSKAAASAASPHGDRDSSASPTGSGDERAEMLPTSGAGATAAGATTGATGDAKLKKHDRIVITKAKEKVRTDISLRRWSKDRYFARPEVLEEPAPHGFIAREHASSLSPEQFIAKYEQPNLPVIISGCADAWPAVERWTIDALYERFRHRKFKCGEDDDGRPVRIKLKYFLRYMEHQTDDSPLYIFDGAFDDDERAQNLLQDFTVPPYFQEDLFSLVGEARRPPYRWFLIGPKRSGTFVHIDPLATSAWNTLLSGRKRWVLMHPSTPKDLVKGVGIRKPGEDDEPLDYFSIMWPRIREAGGPSLQYIEFVQRAGETVFVPGGWWHAVLNLDDTIAVTQNFASTTNFPRVWPATRKGRRHMAATWLEKLKEVRPDLAALALRMNERDKWVMPAPKRQRGPGESSSSSSSSTSCSSDSDDDETKRME